MRLVLTIAALVVLATPAALADTPAPPPVAAVVDGQLSIGPARLPVFVSQDWSRPLPAIRRVVVIVHGYERNAADYARTAMGIGAPGDTLPGETLIIAPQFLAPEDIAAHGLPDAVLRWRREAWSDGEPAEGPVAASAFDALDALLAKAGDRSVLPNVATVVLAGFSAGGQLVQRYAAVGRGESAIGRPGVGLRYVVGSPSSYIYFTDQRPEAPVACPDFNRWKYGFAGDLPPYAAAAATAGVAAMERRYAAREIIYLAGANDDNPNHRYLDKSCAAEAQGPSRIERMTAFFALLRHRDGDILKQRMWTIADAAHNAGKVLGSRCGLAVLFGDAECHDEEDRK